MENQKNQKNDSTPSFIEWCNEKGLDPMQELAQAVAQVINQNLNHYKSIQELEARIVMIEQKDEV